MRRSTITAALALSAMLALPAANAAPQPASWTFSSSTAGLPVGTTVGSWSDQTSGDTGDLSVDVYSVPGVDLTWTATWLSAPTAVQATADDRPVRLASLTAFTGASSIVQASTAEFSAQYRVFEDGTAGPWHDYYSSKVMRSTTTGSSHSSQFAGVLGGGVSVITDRSASYQVEFKVAGRATGDNKSVLLVQTKRG